MKKIFNLLLLLILSIVLCSCVVRDKPFVEKNYEAQLNKVVRANLVSSKYQDIPSELVERLGNFSSKILDGYIKEFGTNKNFTVSPLSIYLAVACLYPTLPDELQEELLNKMGVTKNDFLNTKLLMEQMFQDDDSKLFLTNSVWIQKGYLADENILNDLANIYYCHAFSTDFKNDNTNANKLLREFIRDNTNGLIDKDFDLSPETLYALVNTLYLKDGWNSDGNKLSTEKHAFYNYDGTNQENEFLLGNYYSGYPIINDDFKMFYTRTSNFKVTILLPNEDVDVNILFNAKTLNEMLKAEYCSYDLDKDVFYKTRLIFPQFEASSDEDIIPVFDNQLGIHGVFSEFNSRLLNEPVIVDKINHVATIKVDRSGIEGAATTVISNKATSDDPLKIIESDLLIDRPFIFMISYRNINVFSGICYSMK